MPSTALRQHARVEWDGRRLRVLSGQILRMQLKINGQRFIDLQSGPENDATLEIPFSPSGQARFNVELIANDHSDDPLTAPFSVAMGVCGTRPVMDGPVAITPLHDASRLLPLDACPMQGEVAIVIPVCNAAEAVRRCLDSVLEHSNGAYRVIVINDASTDPAIAPLLESYRSRDRIELHENPRNLGFTATVNRGMQMAARADVLLLNADTEVAANWLVGLRHALHSAPDVATATAVSNNAGAFSVPELEQENPFPPGWSHAQTARATWQDAGHAYPELPTGNGFCMLIRRQVLDAVGLFDVAAFPQGYGEENDFCQRASARGWRHLIAGNVHVAHARSLSFGSDRRQALGQAGMQVLRERWPNYESDVGRTLFSFARRVLDWRLRVSQSSSPSRSPLPRCLHLKNSRSQDRSHEHWLLDVQGEQMNLVAVDGECRESVPVIRFDYLCCAHWLQLHAIERVVLPGSADSLVAGKLAAQAARLGIPASIEENDP